MEDKNLNKEIVGSEINCQDLQAKLNSIEAKKIIFFKRKVKNELLSKAYLPVEIFAIYNFSFVINRNNIYYSSSPYLTIFERFFLIYKRICKHFKNLVMSLTFWNDRNLLTTSFWYHVKNSRGNFELFKPHANGIP